jgi:iron(III) transport system permease protein
MLRDRDRAQTGRWRAERWAMASVLAVVGYLTLVPVGAVLWGSLRTSPPGVPSALSLDNYRRVFTDPAVAASLGDTLVFAGGSTILALAIGTYLAWLTERTDVPGRRLIYVLAMVPLFVPGILTTVAWSLILNDRIGIANAAVSALSGRTEPIFNAYTMAAMIWTDGTDSFTLPFLLMVAAFRAMDPALEEVSHVAGASKFRTFRRVTLPLMTPAVATSGLLVFINTIDSFQVPAIMGLPAGIRVLATEVYLSARRFPVDLNLAATYSMLYLTIALTGLALYWRVVGGSDRFVTVTGRGYRPSRMGLGRSRPVHATVAAVALVLAVAVPLGVMLYASLLTYYRPPTIEVWSQLTLRSYRRVIFETPVVVRAARNNLVAGVLAAVLTIFVGGIVAWTVRRARVRGRRILDILATAPIAFPGLVIAVALMWFYLYVPLPIYATLAIIVLGYVTAFLPFVHRAADVSLAQLGSELEEASLVAGATRLRTLMRIVLPLIAPALLVAGIYVLSRTFRTLSLPVLLAGPGNEVLPVLIYDLQARGSFAELNALGILMVLFLVVTAVSARAIVARGAHSAGRGRAALPEEIGIGR